jgi:hypothetical protein
LRSRRADHPEEGLFHRRRPDKLGDFAITGGSMDCWDIFGKATRQPVCVFLG